MPNKTASIKRYENANKLRCPHLRSEDNFFSYKQNEPPSFWLALNKDPCPTCDNSFCHNYKDKFDDPKRLIILSIR